MKIRDPPTFPARRLAEGVVAAAGDVPVIEHPDHLLFHQFVPGFEFHDAFEGLDGRVQQLGSMHGREVCIDHLPRAIDCGAEAGVGNCTFNDQIDLPAQRTAQGVAQADEPTTEVRISVTVSWSPGVACGPSDSPGFHIESRGWAIESFVRFHDRQLGQDHEDS